MADSVESLLKSLNCTILVVEDSDEVRHMIKSILEKNSYRVITAENGQQALELAQKNEIDIVVTDVHMPVMDGIKLFNELHPKHMPFIFVTSHTDILNSERAYKIGAVEYLNKPFTSQQLLAAVDKATYVANSGFKDSDPGYQRLSVEELMSGETTGREIFLRISPQKFLRVAKADAPITVERLKSYQSKGLKFLYIKKSG